jgi:hypothetical protein
LAGQKKNFSYNPVSIHFPSPLLQTRY